MNPSQCKFISFIHFSYEKTLNLNFACLWLRSNESNIFLDEGEKVFFALVLEIDPVDEKTLSTCRKAH